MRISLKQISIFIVIVSYLILEGYLFSFFLRLFMFKIKIKISFSLIKLFKGIFVIKDHHSIKNWITYKWQGFFKQRLQRFQEIFNINDITIITMVSLYWDHGIYLPHFCYHLGLSIVGNCWACLSELEIAPKPLTSCTAIALTVAKEKRVYHDSPYATKSREGIMEFMLINHPLDCPVCDQGGDCDLQDLSTKAGPVKWRFYK